VDFFDGQNSMILHLADKGLDVPVPIKNVHGSYKSLEIIGRPSCPEQGCQIFVVQHTKKDEKYT
jgi:hypothetical protein